MDTQIVRLMASLFGEQLRHQRPEQLREQRLFEVAEKVTLFYLQNYTSLKAVELGVKTADALLAELEKPR